jgi:tetratricopeptide (TPR) repeat protein
VRYRAFISYSHADAAPASWLHRKLEGWRVPPRMRDADPLLPDRLAPVFRDREELASAGELGPQIQAALLESDALIVLCSPEAARSRWVDAEVEAFRRSGRGDRIFALIVAGEPNSGDERECFPPSLRESEPLAADLRPGKDGKELALLKLISGLLRVPLDTLRQREARRRHQRMLAVTSIAVVVMLVTSVLAVQAMRAREAAERRQKQAEALVGFMLGDLNDKLSEVSRLDILEGVHDHAMAYFQSLPDTDVTAQALEQRAQALLRIGNVRQEQGHLDKALQSYEAAERLAGQLASAAPESIPRQLMHANVLSFIGTMHWYQGEADQAQAGFDAALQVLRRAQARKPNDSELLYQLSTVQNNTGHVLEGRGRIEEATERYELMLASTQRLVAKAPDYKDARTQLGLAHNNLAKMALLQGDLTGAITGYRADVDIEAALLAKDPRNTSQAERFLISNGALGRTLALAGRLDEGADALQRSVSEARRLLALEPNSAAVREDLGIYATQLARLRRLQGDLPAAAALSKESLAALDSLVTQDATHPGWQRDRAEALLEHAQQLRTTEGGEPARTALEDALAVLEPQLAAQGDDRGALLGTIAARLRLAELQPPATALPRLRESLATCEAQASGQRDPRLRALRAELLLRLGERARAEQLAAELLRDGFGDAGFAALLQSHRIKVPPAAPAVASH